MRKIIFYEIPGYDIVRRDRAEKFGGGILCYIQISFNYEHLTALEQSMPDSVYFAETKSSEEVCYIFHVQTSIKVCCLE